LATLDEALYEASRLVEPDEAERRIVSRLSERLLGACRERFMGLNGVVDVTIEGSVAKDTWVKGRAEVDIFVHFERSVGSEILESTILTVGSSVIESLGGRHWLRYASHPYIEGEVGGVRVNIVGCYRVERGGWISPVDRTPYHTAYIRSRVTDALRREIRLLKGFLIGCNLYGAEISVEGFSGYLSELLILAYGGFLELIREASRWRIPTVISMEGGLDPREAMRLFPGASLILLDPVDNSRNVAAAVSKTRHAEFILSSKIFLSRPSPDFFRQNDQRSGIVDWAARLDRNLLGIHFNVKQETPPDILWGEVKRSMRGIVRRLEGGGFRVFRASATQAGDEALILLELETLELPSAELRIGPPVWTENALDFIRKTQGRVERVAGPWVEGERLYALLRRRTRRVEELLRQWIAEGQVSVSPNLRESLKRAEIISTGAGLLERVRGRREFSEFLQNFLEGLTPCIRRYRQG